MDPHHDAADGGEPPAIRDRADAGRGWLRAWPLVALALIGLMLVRACVPSAPSAAPPPPVTPAAR